MKKILFLVLSLFIALASYGQSHKTSSRTAKTAGGVNDPKAHAILDEIRDQIKNSNSLLLDFSYQIENQKEKIKDSKKGQILMRKEQYRLQFMGQDIFCDGKNVWAYSKENKEVQISEADPNSPESLNPLSIINGYEKNFRAKLIREEVKSGSKIAVVDLIPIKNKTFHKIRIFANRNKKSLESSEIYDKNGSIYTYKVEKMQVNVSCKDQDFRFDIQKYPGTEVIDLR